jgi:hypothetical protein
MTKFKFSIGGFFGTSYEIKLKKEALLFYISDRSFPRDLLNDIPTHIIPVKENLNWQKLIKFLESQDWKPSYFNEDILDGTQWEISFTSENSKLKSSGSNEYPTEFKKFMRLLNAITRKHSIPFEVY